jgi:hypothetical protein
VTPSYRGGAILLPGRQGLTFHLLAERKSGGVRCAKTVHPWASQRERDCTRRCERGTAQKATDVRCRPMKQEFGPELTIQRKHNCSLARWRLRKLSIEPKLITTILRSLCSGRDSTWCLGCVVAIGAQAARFRTVVTTRLGSAFAHIHTFSSEGRRCANHIAPLGRRADGAWQTSAGVHHHVHGSGAIRRRSDAAGA